MPTINFKGKTVIETYHHTVPHHRLEFDPKLSLLPKGEKPSLDGNLIIEGDNLLALKALLPTHAGKVKCIYIDPPYNTGNEGWVYNDNLTQPQFKEWIGKTVGKEGEDATRHDKWCCMMYPRLVLLKELLREDGSIWISIDDTEVQHLRLLMDEVFGAENFVAAVVWEKADSPRMDAEFFSVRHDYVLVAAKNKKQFQVRREPYDDENLPGHYDKQDEEGRAYYLKPLRAMGGQGETRAARPKLYYPLTAPDGTEVFPKLQSGEDGAWRWNKEKSARDKWRIEWTEGKTGWTPYFRIYADMSKGRPPETIFPHEDVGSNRTSRAEVKQFLPKGVTFSTPKPIDLLRKIISTSCDKGDLVLDSTAGSGTTAHAVLALNKKDNGTRRFILVQQPYDTKNNEVEKLNICRDITVHRVRNAVAGTGKGRNGSEALGGSFSYVTVGDPLFGEYRDFGKKMPKFEDLAKYIFYTETSREIDLKKVDEKTGFIGSTPAAGGTAYYLLYTPNEKEDRELSTTTLNQIVKKENAKKLVIYCEKIWIHPDELRKFEQENKRDIRPMLVPFNLK